MGLYAPDYYKAFACKGGACAHTCCMGWEIDIDDETYRRYQEIPSPFRERLLSSIEEGDDGRHFALSEGDRCPFLNRENLCDIILRLGEDALCQICADHPRFRNFFARRTEIGLGISCEAACSLILEWPHRPKMVCLGTETEKTPEEEAFFLLRDALLDMIFSASSPKEAFRQIEDAFSIPRDVADWKHIYGHMEMLHPEWSEKLARLDAPPVNPAIPPMAQKQLLAYFLYRHLPMGLEEGNFVSSIAFALHATRMILRLSVSYADFLETAREYSEEIEYSTENIHTLLGFLTEKNKIF